MEKFLIKNAKIVDSEKLTEKESDILIENGIIAEVGNSLVAEGAKAIDAKGLAATPGLFDMHVHLREPGREDKETIETAMKAALKGGVTKMLSMPNTNPFSDNQTVVEYQLSTAIKLGLVKLYVSGRITKDGQVAEIWEMKQKGAVAFTDDGDDVYNENLMRNAMDWATTFGMPILCHSEIRSLAEGQMNEGPTAIKLGLSGIPRSAENIAIQKNIILAEETGARVHICHVSTREGVDFIRRAKEAGVKVTAEVSPHHLALTDEACLNWNTNAKINPPLREEEDRQAVISGLKDGTIDCIATDHAPHLASEKLLPFNDAPVGTVGLETLFGVVNSFLIREGLLTLPDAISKLTLGPARVLGVPAPKIEKGAPADIAIFDLNKEWTVDPAKFESKGKNSVFGGMKLTGAAEYVFYGGKLLLDKGEVN